jgi:hypothetical protein
MAGARKFVERIDDRMDDASDELAHFIGAIRLKVQAKLMLQRP